MEETAFFSFLFSYDKYEMTNSQHPHSTFVVKGRSFETDTLDLVLTAEKSLMSKNLRSIKRILTSWTDLN